MPRVEGGGGVAITSLSNLHVKLTRPAIYTKSPHQCFEKKKKNYVYATFKNVYRCLHNGLRSFIGLLVLASESAKDV